MEDKSPEQLLAEARRKEIEDLKWLMTHEPGRRFMWRLLEAAGVYRTSFNNSGSITAFNEGQRNVGLRFLAEIHEHLPERYVQMLKEKK